MVCRPVALHTPHPQPLPAGGRGVALRNSTAGIISVFVFVGPASAERIENRVALFSALDKVTARIEQFKVELGKTATFGALKVTPRACYSRPTTEQPKTTTFVEVDEVQLDGQEKRVFTGWMFAESPGLYGVEHPTFDVWLNECQTPLKAVVQKAATPAAKGAPSAEGAADAEAPAGGDDDVPLEPRRRVRR